VLHILEAGYESPGRPCVVLLHGFPELAYTWRNQMLPLARAGYHVIAPDARGYGLSAPRPVAYTDDIVPYSLFNRVADVLGLVRALGCSEVAMVVGHDWGGPTAQWCALLRPDVFRSVVSISTPFLRSPALPLDSAAHPAAVETEVDIDKALAALPRPTTRILSSHVRHPSSRKCRPTTSWILAREWRRRWPSISPRRNTLPPAVG
jgi:non-specific protein-tyrosine kinase